MAPKKVLQGSPSNSWHYLPELWLATPLPSERHRFWHRLWGFLLHLSRLVGLLSTLQVLWSPMVPHQGPVPRKCHRSWQCEPHLGQLQVKAAPCMFRWIMWFFYSFLPMILGKYFWKTWLYDQHISKKNIFGKTFLFRDVKKLEPQLSSYDCYGHMCFLGRQ